MLRPSTYAHLRAAARKQKISQNALLQRYLYLALRAFQEENLFIRALLAEQSFYTQLRECYEQH